MNARPHIAALDGLRFFAAFFVTLGHAVSWKIDAALGLPGYAFFTHLPYLGMSLFFVLSGFVIHLNYRDIGSGARGSIRRFALARFSRLYPLFIIVVVLAWEPPVAPAQADHPGIIAHFLTLTQSWLYAPHGDKALIYQFPTAIAVSWSISTEFFFYVAYVALAFLLVRTLRTPARIVFAAVAVCAVMLAAHGAVWHYGAQVNGWAVARFGPVADVAAFESSFMRWLVYFSPYMRLGEFMLGALAAHLYMMRADSPARRCGAGIVTSLAALALIYAVGAQQPMEDGIFLHVAFAPFIAALLYCTARHRAHPVSRLLGSRALVAGGHASYSIYLLHPAFIMAAPMLSHAASVPDAILKSTALLVVIIVPLLLVSVLTYRGFERPVQRAIRALAHSRSQRV